MFNNTARGLTFKKKMAPVNGSYHFLVTELYRVDNKDVDVSYEVQKPADCVDFYWTETGFVLDVADETFDELLSKAKQLDCEIYIYPKFTE